MSQAYDALHNELVSIALLSEGSLLRKVAFQEHVRSAPVNVCNNYGFLGQPHPDHRHDEGQVVEISGDRYVSHYVGGYHYFQLAD